MISRRHAIRSGLAFVAAPTVAVLSPAGVYAQAFQRYTAFLVDLQGWQGKTPDGMAMEIPGNSIITATRDYQRGAASLTAQIIIGPMAQGALAGLNQTVKIETRDGRVYTADIDGFPTLTTFNTADKSGAIVVKLGTAALFNLTFNGVAEDEALTLARRFNWKAIQAALPK